MEIGVWLTLYDQAYGARVGALAPFPTLIGYEFARCRGVGEGGDHLAHSY
ncbi:hypothetical protein LI99_22735 [Mycolicibacterium smegmatis]|uniref:Uncharacterized protein n=1 Tax=Mycolicibacterium smegmatis (strain ATCC 700084 / mc(2)155) TaxID=246196 RepID=A0R126_MYCS2|nr:hypothetical protein MSMEG_4594 [Mycolicibacterium smegmatis MC2 155]AIU09662.1 hypothetical protein LJ00_22730 [Mycolicibacterium smegmatis MC2 155]AIU16287.1 hypothetical protein LI99_22735 [Mycolicibacterium smegmatis]AIU22910.1 hypothetical protein LI98_22740 [Mycolicibacterium smegmatis]